MLVKCPRCGEFYEDQDAEDIYDEDQCCACDDEIIKSQREAMPGLPDDAFPFKPC